MAWKPCGLWYAAAELQSKLQRCSLPLKLLLVANCSHSAFRLNGRLSVDSGFPSASNCVLGHLASSGRIPNTASPTLDVRFIVDSFQAVGIVENCSAC